MKTVIEVGVWLGLGWVSVRIKVRAWIRIMVRVRIKD